MGQMLVFGNPRKRRAKKARRKSAKRTSARKMTAKQLLYFGPKAGARRRRRASTGYAANPSRRSRRVRRNPISTATLRASATSAGVVVKRAVTGAAGAIAVDMVAGQVMPFLPAALGQQYNADGSQNLGYHATKAALALGVGMVGGKVLPGRFKGYAAKAAEGSLTVQAYGLMRAYLPAGVALGKYMNPARIASNGNGVAGLRGVRGLRGLGAYERTRMPLAGRGAFGAGSAFSGGVAPSEMRVGEGPIQ